MMKTEEEPKRGNSIKIFPAIEKLCAHKYLKIAQCPWKEVANESACHIGSFTSAQRACLIRVETLVDQASPSVTHTTSLSTNKSLLTIIQRAACFGFKTSMGT